LEIDSEKVINYRDKSIFDKRRNNTIFDKRKVENNAIDYQSMVRILLISMFSFVFFFYSSCCAACCSTDYCNDEPVEEITNHYCLSSRTYREQPWTVTVFVASVIAFKFFIS